MRLLLVILCTVFGWQLIQELLWHKAAPLGTNSKGAVKVICARCAPESPPLHCWRFDRVASRPLGLDHSDFCRAPQPQ